MTKQFFGLMLAMILLGLGCATIRTPFTYSEPKYDQLPLDALRNVAIQIESDVRAGNREPSLESRDGIILDTPEIKQALRSRAARIEILDAFMNSGNGYEQSNGLVHILRTKEYKLNFTRQERDRDALLVMGENENRWSLYEGLINANGLPGGSTSAIQEIFYKARVEALPVGMKYQDASGAIVVK